MFVGDLTLVTEVPEVLGIPREELENWRPERPASYRPNLQLRYTGPLFARLDIPLSERVECFLAREDPRPIVYVAITSSEAHLVRNVIEALRPIGVRILVASTIHDLRNTDEDILVEPMLPGHLVMPRVDLAVTAGGQGSVQTALASGTPLVGVPLQPEQDLNLRLAEKQGAAKLVPLALASTPTMTATVCEVLRVPSFRENARRVQAIYARVDGPSSAADAILEML
jgi:UDP:flavonoid glycosyltransferase YjiC (YdhE family)